MRAAAPLVLLALLAAAGAALVAVQDIAPARPPHFDEAAHALLGLQMADSLARGDLLALAFDGYRQALWPPLYAWTLGAGFFLAGVSRTSGRVVSLVAYLALAAALYVLGHAVARRTPPGQAGGDARARARWTGLVAAGLALVAPLDRALAAVMRPELLSATVLALGLWALLRAGAEQPLRSSARRWLVAGGLIVLAYLARAQYGLLLLGTVALDRALDWVLAARGRAGALLSRSNAAWLAPLALFGLVWFGYAPKAEATLQWLRTAYGYTDGPQAPGLANALYYPLALAPAAGSAVIAAGLGAALLLALARPRERALRVPATLAVLQLIPALGSTNHQMRLILPLLVALDVLAACGLVAGLERLAAGRPRLAVAGAAGAAAVLLAGLLAPTAAVDVIPVDRVDPAPVLDYVAAEARAEPAVLILGGRRAGLGLDYFLLDWHLVAEARVVPLQGSGLLYPPWSRARSVPLGALERLGLPQTMLAALEELAARGERPDPPGTGRTLWVAMAADAPQPRTAPELRAVLAPALAAYTPRRIVVIADRSRRTRYSPELWRAAIEDGRYTLLAARDFPANQVTVLTYGYGVRGAGCGAALRAAGTGCGVSRSHSRPPP